MCWKQEWAAAVNNLSWAIIHTERAKAKLEKRALNDMHKTLSPRDVAAAKRGLEECEALIAGFKVDQRQLNILIEEVGLWVSENPARTPAMIVGRRKTSGRPW